MQIIIERKEYSLLHSLIANAQCHLIKKSYLPKIDKDTLQFSKELQDRINKIRKA